MQFRGNMCTQMYTPAIKSEFRLRWAHSCSVSSCWDSRSNSSWFAHRLTVVKTKEARCSGMNGKIV